MSWKLALAAPVLGLIAMAAVLGVTTAQQAIAGNGVFAIVLSPPTDTNDVGTEHTVTATVTFDGNPLADQTVDFQIMSGPNAGEVGQDTTDLSGEATFTYTGDGGVGQDVIQACTGQIIGIVGQPQECDTATKDWVQPTPTPTPTPTPSPTATATPTQAAPAAQLPDTGAQPPADSGFPWFLAVIVALGALAVAGGTLLRGRTR